MDWNEILGQMLFLLLLSALTAAGSTLAVFLKHLAARAAQGRQRDYLDLLAVLVEETVAALDQRVVDPVKKAGRWDADQARLVKDEAKRTVLERLKDGQRRVLERLVADLPGMIDDMIERQVGAQRAAGVATRKAAGGTP